jgi:alpha-galactosidase
MSGPKVCVIGAGSYYFGREIICKMATSDLMAGGALALVDTDPSVLRTMMRLARRVFKKTRNRVRLLGSTRRREVMEGSDFVVLTFSHRNTFYRGLDVEIAKKHGITLASADTIGPAGVFRALRELPEVLAAAKDAEKLAPHAWLINYVNPTAVMGIALMRHAPKVRSFALCDAQREPMMSMNWLKMVGILPYDAERIPPEVLNKLDLRVAGVNHCTWMLKFHYAGKDMLPVLKKILKTLNPLEAQNPAAESKMRFCNHYALSLFDIYGAYPTNVAHTKEYVPFFQGYGVKAARPEPIITFDAKQRQQEMDAFWKDTKKFASGKLPMKKFLADTPSELATDIIETMWGSLGNRFFINTANRGAVTNMADDDFIELKCDVDMQGPRPHPVGEMPHGLLAMSRQVLDTHELTVEAALTGDRAILRRALLTDPIVNNVEDADACIREMLKRQREALPGCWFKRGRK